MTRTLRAAFIGSAVIALGTTARAQTCNGAPSFSTGGARFSGGALLGQHADAYGAQVVVGKHASWFVSGTYEYARAADSTRSANAAGAELGYERPLTTDGRVSLCPMGGFTVQSGSVVGLTPVAGGPRSTTDWNFGGSLGWVASQSSSLRVIPSLSALIVTRASRTKAGAGQPSRNYPDNFGLLTARIGFVFGTHFTISPVVQVPVRETDGRAAYGIALSYSLANQ